MNKSESVVKKTELAIDDFRDLWKRRKFICIIVLIIIITPILVSVFTIPRLSFKLCKAEQERDKAQLQLAPFLAVANKTFSESPPDGRLELLADKMDKMIGAFGDSKQEILLQLTEIKRDIHTIQPSSSRVLSKNAVQLLIGNLKSTQSLETEILCTMGDNEAFELANQIKNIFKKAAWPVNGVNQAIFARPVKNLIVQFSEIPSRDLQKALLPLFDNLGCPRKAEVNKSLASNKMKIIVGGK